MGFTWIFPGNQDATLKYMSELTFIRFCYFLKYLIDPESKGCLEKAKSTECWGGEGVANENMKKTPTKSRILLKTVRHQKFMSIYNTWDT